MGCDHLGDQLGEVDHQKWAKSWEKAIIVFCQPLCGDHRTTFVQSAPGLTSCFKNTTKCIKI